MGNNPSSTAQRPREPSQSQQPRFSSDSGQRREPRRRESIHALPATAPKATPAPPSTNLESAIGQPISTSSSPSQTKSHSRNRSATIPAAPLKPSTDRLAMGSDQSRLEPAIPIPTRKDIAAPSPASKPIDTPAGKGRVAVSPISQFDTPSVLDAYNDFSRPPRLPLPIEEEVHTPGSPIISALDPADGPEDVAILNPEPTSAVLGDGIDGESAVQRKNSVISSNADEEDEPEEFLPYTGPNAAKISTTIEWRDAEPTDKIYVTGTFAGWERKFRLHWDGPSKHPNTLSTSLQLPPGTHHLKFLVNNDMQVSPHLPTTVDFTNILVNYIEVAQPTVTAGPVTKPMEIRNKQASGTSSPARSSPATRAAGHTASPSTAGARSSPKPAAKTGPVIKQVPSKKYTSQIPAYLLDLDTWPPPTDSPDSSADESSTASKYHRANAAANAQPEPPSLPLFLSRSILNSSTAAKDDSSVLVLPNHTVLNHLSTTSIRAGVLASSCTCRYKQRFLTTIFYRPRGEDGE